MLSRLNSCLKKTLYVFLSCFWLHTTFAQENAGKPATLFESQPKGFVENVGQIKDQNGNPNLKAKYLFSLPNGMNVQLKANSFSYDTYTSSQQAESSPSTGHSAFLKQSFLPQKYSLKFHRVDVTLPGANMAPRIIVENASPSVYHYYTTGASRLSAHDYQKITYRDIYPNIDLVFQVKSGIDGPKFEYYFIVKPRGLLQQITLQYNGGLATQLKNNQIEVRVAKGMFNEQMPCSYLSNAERVDVNNLAKARKIEIKYRKTGPDTYGFKAAAYNKSKTLIIDPTPDLLWGTYYGGTNNDWGTSIAKDVAGNIFIAGASDNAGNIATAGAYQTTMLGSSDALFAKFTADGNLLWASYYGGSSFDAFCSIAIDKNNNLFIAGNSYSPDNISTPGAFQPEKKGPAWSAPISFVVKFDKDGARQWATYYSGDGATNFNAVAVDGNNNILLTGWTASQNGIATAGTWQPAFALAGDQIRDAFVVKFDNNGNRLWGTYFGGTGDDAGYGITTDKQNNVIITGLTYSTAGIATSGATQTALASTSPEGGDGYVAKFNNVGILQWATYLGGGKGDFTWCVGTDSNDNVIVGGTSGSSNNIATPGTQQPISIASIYAKGYLVKYSSNGSRIWGTYYGDEGTDINGLAIDSDDNIWITGTSASSGNITTPGVYQPLIGTPNTQNAFIAKFSAPGLRLWGSFYGAGGYSNGQGNAIVITGKGEAAITGVTSAKTMVATCGAIQSTWGGNQDVLVAKFSETNSSNIPALSISKNLSDPICAGTVVTFKASPTNGGKFPAFQWKLNGNNVGTNSSEFTTTSLKTGDVLNCVMTSSSACIINPTVASNPLTIVVTEPGAPTISINSSASAICPGTEVEFSATTQNEGAAPIYQWKLNNNNVGSNSAKYITTTLIDADVVSCVLTSSSSCVTTPTANSNNIQIAVTATVTPTLSIAVSNNNICANTPVSFTATATNQGANAVYQWQVNNQNTGTNSAVYSTVDLKDGDVVRCILTTPGTGCAAGPFVSNTVSMIIYAAPSIKIASQNLSVLKGNSIDLGVKVSGASNTYTWSPAIGLSISTIASPIASPQSTTTYQLTATSENGCETTATIIVNVLSEIKIPNVFTPNGDSVNDTWEIAGLNDYLGCKVDIYNRYGQPLFHSVGYSKPWNGTYNNKPLHFGVYYYIITLGDGKPPLSGSITLIK